MQDNFDLKGFLRNNTLLNEGIGGYFDLKPLKEYGADPRMAQMDIDQDFIERVHQELTPEESAWLVDNVDKLKAQFFEKFAELEGDVDGMTALVKQLYFEKDADSEMTELNDLGNMEEDEEEDGFIQAQRDAVGKKGSQIFDIGWQYDDDEEDGFIQAQRDAVGAKGSSLYGDMNEDDDFIQAQRDAVGAKGSSMYGDSNEFDFEDFDDTDLNGPSVEMIIDDLIGEFEQIIKSQVPEELQDSARTSVKELWKYKLDSWGI